MLTAEMVARGDPHWQVVLMGPNAKTVLLYATEAGAAGALAAFLAATSDLPGSGGHGEVAAMVPVSLRDDRGVGVVALAGFGGYTTAMMFEAPAIIRFEAVYGEAHKGWAQTERVGF